jgi:hypothetical protein
MDKVQKPSNSETKSSVSQFSPRCEFSKRTYQCQAVFHVAAKTFYTYYNPFFSKTMHHSWWMLRFPAPRMRLSCFLNNPIHTKTDIIRKPNTVQNVSVISSHFHDTLANQ